MGKKKGSKGRAARNAATKQKGDDEEGEFSKAPHSFVFHRGHVGKTVKELVKDMRQIMEPYTASRLKVRKKNVMKDFLTQAGPLHVSHFIVFTKTDIATYMRLICVPRGPTLTFKVNEFTLARDVLSFQKHPDVESKLFNNHAVMVTNMPADNMENKLMNVTFKNMFPSINPNIVKLNNMRRTVLVNYDKETKSVDVRHFTMKVVPTGISRAMKKLMKPKLPDMSKHTDIADVFLDKGLSDSEGEQDGPHSKVTVTQKIKDRGVARNATNAIRLKEIGPRLNLTLMKIEEGFEAGNVLYHSLVQKTPADIEALKKIKEHKKKEKLARKQRQEANVQKKKEAKEDQVKQTLKGMDKKKGEGKKDKEDETKKGEDEDDSEDEGKEKKKEESESEDDYDYYKKEVGQAPEPEMFVKRVKRKSRTEAEKGPKEKRSKHEGYHRNQSPKYGDKQKPPSKFSVKFSQKDGKRQTGSSPGKRDFSGKSGKRDFSGKSGKSDFSGKSGKRDFSGNSKSGSRDFSGGKKAPFKGKGKR